MLLGATAALTFMYNYELKNQDVVVSEPMAQESKQFSNLEAIPIPAHLVSETVESTYSQVEYFTVNDEEHVVYFEFDQNDNFHYIGASEDLANLLKNVPSNLIFNGFENENAITIPTASAGEHSDCIQGCNEFFTDEDGGKIKGRGRCKTNCWIDTIIDLLPLFL